MTAKDPRAAETGNQGLTAEEAERFSAQVRPSWEEPEASAPTRAEAAPTGDDNASKLDSNETYEIPLTGIAPATLLKILVAVLGIGGLIVGARALLGGPNDKKAQPTSTASNAAAQAPLAARPTAVVTSIQSQTAAPTTAAKLPSEPPVTPTSAPSATAPATAQARPSTSESTVTAAAKPEPLPATEAKAAPPPPEKKAVAVAAPPPTSTPASPPTAQPPPAAKPPPPENKPSGGGLIRETPF